MKKSLNLVVFLIAILLLFFLYLPQDQEKKELEVEQPTSFIEMQKVIPSPNATPTPITLKVVVEPLGWVNNYNCTVTAVVENIGIENIRFHLIFNGVPWSSELIPDGRRSAAIPLSFGNIEKGYLTIYVRGDVNQTGKVLCSSSSSGLSTPSLAVTLDPATPTPPPGSIPEFPSLAFPVLSVFILLFLFRKN
jgi:hypothetical protein